ncbi:MAG TPA: hypothetical protein VGS78_13245 [Candidatus Sulfotelmatobacter sp.]|nr:hypothetical protein [Candidatus Sulfotelmatobacter sp.]
MLVAEIHGKYVREARSSEDYLTSAVFGHLRYVPPGPFWETLFELAISLPINRRLISAGEYIREHAGRSLSSYTNLRAIFWPNHPKGIPDVVLHFHASKASPVVIIIEAKLEAGKSGTGDDDQLARYLGLLDSLGDLRPKVPSDAIRVLVYLTTMDSRSDLMESLSVHGDTDASREHLYRLQWQDLVTAVERTRVTDSHEALILEDVRAFLRKRDLEYFSGMVDQSDMPVMALTDGELFANEPLFDAGDVPTDIAEILEGWMHAN